MSQRISLFLVGLLCWIASATAFAQTINGHVSGIEICAQSMSICEGYARFLGTFVGRINGTDTTAVLFVRVQHEDLNEEKKGVTKVTAGDWTLILNNNTAITGTVASGTLIFRPNNTFTVDLTLPISGSTSTTYFDGTLNHNVFPPTFVGRLRTK